MSKGTTNMLQHDSEHGFDTAGRPLVRAVGVRKWFGRLEVLKGISLTVARGEVLSIVGRSGSGKSTFLRCINNLETYQEGRLFVGDDLIGYREADGRLRPLATSAIVSQRRRIGMVFQQFNLFWHMTVLENVIEGPMRVLGEQRETAVERARELLRRVGLGDKIDSYPMKLSGGQQQRAAIARALAMQPELMLFDEPTSALDPETTGEVLAVIGDLAKSGMTMVIVTHEMSFARQVSNRIAFMEDGQVETIAPPQAFFGNSGNERLERFLATIH